VARAKSIRRTAERGSTARTIRFPHALRRRLAADAERCGRSFEAHVLAILRSHFGENVDLAPAPEEILAALRGSALGISDKDWEDVTRRADEP
jgi:hypothetical protein